MHVLFKAGGHRAQSRLWAIRGSGVLTLQELEESDADRMAALMANYRNVPMDLADASLVAVAERLGLRRIFTLDGDFRIYRLADGSGFDVIP